MKGGALLLNQDMRAVVTILLADQGTCQFPLALSPCGTDRGLPTVEVSEVFLLLPAPLAYDHLLLR